MKSLNLVPKACLLSSLLCLTQLARTQTNNYLADSLFNTFIQQPAVVDLEQIIESTRSLPCLPMIRIFTLELRHTLRSGERIGLTGDHVTLGRWQVERALEMRTSDASGLHWSLRLAICAVDRLHYRYFIFSLDTYGRRRIREWEAQQHARMLEYYEMYSGAGHDIFGEVEQLTMGDVEKERGWLRYEYVIELKFVWEKQLRLQRKMKLRRKQKFLLQLAPLHTRNDNVEFEVSRYSYNHSQFRHQPARGVLYGKNDVVIFRITASLRAHHSFRLTISTLEQHEIGHVTISSVDLHGSEGTLVLPIYSAADSFQVGVLTLPYLIIEPLPNAAQLNFRGSFHHYWPPNWPPMEVGHRGAGQSYGNKAAATRIENTINSFLHIYHNHGDMVEFNVQVTKDLLPVLWYDFGFYTAPPSKVVRHKSDAAYVMIEDLTYDQLKRVRVFTRNGSKLRELTHLNVRDKQKRSRIFPLLSEVYQQLPKSLGLNVEIKWPQLMQSGGWESAEPPLLDKNRYVDAILETTAKHGCGRPLIFSSFDADICTLVRQKQNVFPVMLISEGETTQSEAYADLRTRSFLQAVNFAQSENILGTAPHAGDFLDDMHSLNLGLDLAQIVFVWGADLNDVEVLARFRSADVTGLIYDDMQHHMGLKKRHSFFDSKELKEIFARQCVAIGNASWMEYTNNANRNSLAHKFDDD